MSLKLLREISSILREEGIELVELEINVHVKLRIRCADGTIRMVACAKTPGDHRNMMNLRHDLRRAYRTGGVARVHKTS